MIIFPKNKIYNSYIVETENIDNAVEAIKEYITEFDFSKNLLDENSHPDFFMIDRDNKQSIPIEVVRENLINKISTMPIISKRKIFVLKIDTFLKDEVQNAILKTLEEPPDYVSIFLLIKNRETLLDTIKSRCVYIKDSDNSSIINDVKDNQYIEDIIKIVVDLKYKDIYDIINLSEILSKIKSNDEFKKVVYYMMYLARDSFYYKKTFDENNLLLKNRIMEIKSMADVYNYFGLSTFINLLDETLPYIDSNVDKKLLIEDILIRTKKVLG